MNVESPVLAALASAVLLGGCAGAGALTPAEEHNVEVVRQAHAALAAGDLEAFEATLAPDYVRHCQAMPPGAQELHGTAEFLAFLREFKEAVPVHEDVLEHFVVRGDRVAYVSTFRGVQSGPLGELPASGRPFTLVNVIVQRLEDGRIAETWVSWDNVAFLTQLGHMPE